MATVQHIVNGPSRWDLMQSLFTRETVSFTLESGFVVKGRVTTLHDHGYDDTIVDEIKGQNFAYTVENLHDWLVLMVPSAGGPQDFNVAMFEYHERSRTGASVVITDNEYESLEKKIPISDIYYMPSIWLRMMDPENYE